MSRTVETAASGVASGCDPATPALLTSRSRPPNSDPSQASAWVASSSDVTSRRRVCREGVSAFARSSFASPRPAITTVFA